METYGIREKKGRRKGGKKAEDEHYPRVSEAGLSVHAFSLSVPENRQAALCKFKARDISPRPVKDCTVRSCLSKQKTNLS